MMTEVSQDYNRAKKFLSPSDAMNTVVVRMWWYNTLPRVCDDGIVNKPTALSVI